MTRAHDEAVEEPDPAARAKRRTHTAEYKARILAEYESLPDHSPERGALVRREGLYSSHIAEWRKARDAAAMEGLAPKTRKPRRSAEEVALENLRQRNEWLEAEPRPLRGTAPRRVGRRSAGVRSPRTRRA